MWKMLTDALLGPRLLADLGSTITPGAPGAAQRYIAAKQNAAAPVEAAIGSDIQAAQAKDASTLDAAKVLAKDVKAFQGLELSPSVQEKVLKAQGILSKPTATKAEIVQSLKLLQDAMKTHKADIKAEEDMLNPKAIPLSKGPTFGDAAAKAPDSNPDMWKGGLEPDLPLSPPDPQEKKGAGIPLMRPGEGLPSLAGDPQAKAREIDAQRAQKKQ